VVRRDGSCGRPVRRRAGIPPRRADAVALVAALVTERDAGRQGHLDALEEELHRLEHGQVGRVLVALVGGLDDRGRQAFPRQPGPRGEHRGQELLRGRVPARVDDAQVRELEPEREREEPVDELAVK
jgi:hypothetical protein